MNSANRAYMRAAALGLITGLRSMSGLATFSSAAAEHPRRLRGTPFAALATPRAARITQLLAAGELAADKLPVLPARTAPAPLAGRMLVGALAGAAACAELDQPAAVGALLGAAGAFLASHAGYRLRRGLVRHLHLPDTLVALLEDGLVIAAGRQFVARA